MTSIDEFYTVTKGLSLNDTFWLKPQGCSLSWKDVKPIRKPNMYRLCKFSVKGYESWFNKQCE